MKQKKQLSKTKIKQRVRRKTNPDVRKTLVLAIKHPSWHKLAQILSSSTRAYAARNLFELDKQTTEGDTIVIPGKVLSQGDITKKIRIAALSISTTAKEKLKRTKSEFVPLDEEIKKNPRAEAVKLLP